MKIGILTYHYSNNYGALLQTYALSMFLKEQGHMLHIINKCPEQNTNLSFSRRIKRPIIGVIHRQFTKSFSKFRKEHFSLTKRVVSFNEMKELAKTFDAVIVGSDQVWRLDYTKGLGLNNFLDFVPDEIPKISYAASFGKDTFEAEIETRKKITFLLKRFKAISVREKSGVEICKDVFNIKAEHLLDPTMILTPQHYYDLINNKKLKLPEKFVTRYFLDPTDDKVRVAEYFAKKYNCKPINAYKNASGNFSLKNFELNIKDYYYPSFSQWLASISKSEFIVTDSFHGAVFSIIFNKQFVCIANKQRGLTRFQSLLSKFKLEDRLIVNTLDFKKQVLKPIDYEKVNNILNEERKLTADFFREIGL